MTSSASEQLIRNIDAERLGGLEIDYQLVLGRRLHWKVGGFLALENAARVATQVKHIAEVVSGTQEPTRRSEFGPTGDHGAQKMD